MSDDIRAVLCRKWTIEILRLLAQESPKNYNGIEAELETSSDVVVDHLRQLVNADLLNRDEHSPKDVQYSITANGKELVRLVEEIHRLLDQ